MISKHTISVLFCAAPILTITGLFLPTSYSHSSSSDGFASGLFSGMWYGYEELAFATLLLPPIGIFFILVMIGQIVLAVKNLLSKDYKYRVRWAYYFMAVGLILRIVINLIENHQYSYGDKVYIGAYVSAIGVVFTSLALYFDRKSTQS